MVAIGCWQFVGGSWLVAIGGWQVVGGSLLVNKLLVAVGRRRRKEGGGADTTLKAETPHVNVRNKKMGKKKFEGC